MAMPSDIFPFFKEIKSKWQYVPDPKLEEYYAPATETYYHLSGDCDDYSIFMASCILAVGGGSQACQDNWTYLS